MLAVATHEIQALYESQPLLTQVGSFPLPGSGGDDAVDNASEDKDDDSASG